MRSKSLRKPLREVSNVETASELPNKKTLVEEENADDSVDRLLFLHSEVSSTMRQMDELVVQAIQSTGIHDRGNIKELLEFLSGLQSSLKTWIPKFQKALVSDPLGPENKLDRSLEGSVACVGNGKEDTIPESPQISKRMSLVSPSPLVSWRDEYNMGNGRQLFLLTPLPQKKGFASKSNASCLFEKIHSHEDVHPAAIESNPPDKVDVAKAAENMGISCSSPHKSTKMNCPVYVMTPLLKMSPPKSCVLLEPASVFSVKKNKSRSVPAGIHSLDSESSGSLASDDLTKRYPELIGIKRNKIVCRKDLENSPNWSFSPPKTCAIMEPQDEKSKENHGRALVMTNATATTTQEYKTSFMNDVSTRHGLVESTPMVKELKPSYQKAKHPGENTLKRELWTKFDATSPHPICFKLPVHQKTAQKGFLDRLDEAF